MGWILLSHMNQNHADLEKKDEKKAIIMSNEVDEKDQIKLKEECTAVFELCKPSLHLVYQSEEFVNDIIYQF